MPFGGAGLPNVASAQGFSPAWSKTGRWIAFFRRTGEGFAILRSSPTGDETVKLADGAISPPTYTETPYLKTNVNDLDWSPDDQLLAYSASREDISNIWLSASDGSGITAVSQNSDKGEIFCCPMWTNSGDQLVFFSRHDSPSSPRQTTYRLWLYRVADAEQKVVLESSQRFRFLGFGRDEDTALFVQLADPAHSPASPAIIDLYALSLSTSARSKVNSLGDAYFHNIHLSSDGRMIAFTSRRDNITALWTVPVNGGTPRRILVENDPKIMISSLAWAPDGKSIVFGKQTRTNLFSMLAK
jgi:Tol biopolymer transport system component